MRIFKYLKQAKLAILLIFGLLIVQAYCDLALPRYMSNIVDVGIQQGGIENAVPEKIRSTTLHDLALFMTDEELGIVNASYAENEAGIYVLQQQDSQTINELNRIFQVPMVILAQMATSGEMKLDELKLAVDSGLMSRDQLLGMRQDAMEAMEGLNESLLDQMAVMFVRNEYEALGLDLGSVQNRYLWRTGGAMIGVTAVLMIASILVGFVASRVSAKIGVDLRAKVFHKVVSFSNSEIDKFSTASLITRTTNDIQQVQMVTVMLLRMVLYAPILGIGGVIMVAHTRTGMSWIIGVAVGAIMLLVGTLVSIAMPKFKKMQQLVDRLNLVSREILTGISVIRAFGRERHEEQRFARANRDLMQTQLFTNRVMTFMMPMMMLIMNGIMIMIVWFGGKGISAGQLQVGDMMAFITYTIQIVMSFMMLTMVSIMLPRANVSAARIDEVLQTEPSIVDKPQVAEEKRSWRGEVAFHDVSFRFPGAEDNVLEHISFTAKPGQTTAIIGSTGSGKSTLLHLIPRFYDVTEGRITIDGVDIRDMSQQTLRSLLGYVPQKNVLFSGTIESNLKFGGDDISDEAVREAAEIAQALEFIEQKTDKFQSPIAQGGTNVSGGQKQRLSIARAIAKHPKIYLFDDSFSALDYKTDVVLRRALFEKVGDATVIIVAQRISTIRHADQIIVLDEGRIAGIGTHAELLETCETYREIARSQLPEEELEQKAGVANE